MKAARVTLKKKRSTQGAPLWDAVVKPYSSILSTTSPYDEMKSASLSLL